MRYEKCRFVSLGLSAVLIAGCAGGVSTSVKEQNKDPDNSYDGVYVATVRHPGGMQEMGNNWFNHCSPVNFTDSVEIDDSQVTWQLDEDTAIEGFVDSQGRFRIEHELGDHASGMGVVLSNNSVTIILQGILHEDSMKGRLVYGMGQFNGRGCSYPVKYRLSS